MSNQTNELKNMMASFFQMNTASSSGSGSLPSNTVANLRGDLKSITTRSGITYDGSQIPPPLSPLPKVMEWETEPKPSIPYPSRANKQKLREKDDNLALKFVKIFRELHFELSFADALLHMPKFASMFKSHLNNKEKFFDLAKTRGMEILVEWLALADLGASINLMPFSIWKKLSLPKLTPTQMILELADRSTTSPSGIAEDVFVKVGKFNFSADFVVVDYVVDPRVPLILGRPFLRMTCALIDVYACEEYAQEVLVFLDSSTSRNPTPSLDPILSTSSPLSHLLRKGDLLLLEKLLNDDPSSPLLLKELMFDDLKEDEKILIDPQDQEKTTFTCPYGTFAYRRMSFGLCNAPGTFQRCIMAIFHDMIEETMEEKCHFMVKEGIVLGHKISKSGIEVDKAKVDVIAKLPHPTSVKGI
ncbi:reverse transcriptase domain-containing protein [Tanacetum coccineum]|uniref:Reverse transcriptase domain-containing protein n=1 Tax=Tanacetum coccineum TaxID=301880 RepID=A0ABQ4XTS8_9ASTR